MSKKINFKNNLMMAPMAGYTDAGFRQLCAEHHCGVVVTEMVSAMALKQRSKISFDMLADDFCGVGDTVRSVQLFGHDAEVFKEIVNLKEIQKFDIIDINMGCPMPKIVKNGEGCALMLDLSNASKIIKTVVKKSGKPVSVKFRKGFKEENAADFAKMCEESGASFLTVHGRTQEQMYSEKADWEAIARVVKSATVPVFANGDIKTKEALEAVLLQTGAFGAAIGRAALGKPYLFAELTGKNYTVNIADLIARHVEILLKIFKEEIVASEMRKHFIWYFKGVKNSKPLLAKLFAFNTVGEQLLAIKEFFRMNATLNF